MSDDEKIRLENKNLKEEKSENKLLKVKLDKIQKDLDHVKRWIEMEQKFEKR